MFLRGTVYWVQDNEIGKQESLRTRDRDEAERLLSVKNEAYRQPILKCSARVSRTGRVRIIEQHEQ